MNDIYSDLQAAFLSLRVAHITTKNCETISDRSKKEISDILCEASNQILQAAALVWSLGTGSPLHSHFARGDESIDPKDPRWECKHRGAF